MNISLLKRSYKIHQYTVGCRRLPEMADPDNMFCLKQPKHLRVVFFIHKAGMKTLEQC
jgi:hypothetical protein